MATSKVDRSKAWIALNQGLISESPRFHRIIPRIREETKCSIQIVKKNGDNVEEKSDSSRLGWGLNPNRTSA